jgi:hypothetical protein
VLFIVTTPLDALHTPPGVEDASVIVDPIHTDVPPVIAAGRGFIVATAVRVQPVETNETEMVEVPAESPVSV